MAAKARGSYELLAGSLQAADPDDDVMAAGEAFGDVAVSPPSSSSSRSSARKHGRDGESVQFDDERESLKRRRRFVAVMFVVVLLLVGGVAAVVAGITNAAVVAEEAAEHNGHNGGGHSSGDKGRTPLVLLISLDGFRSDYLQRGVTPNLNALASSGVRAEYMQSMFPTKTFPNHYTIITGLYPESHGIVSNTMYDPVLQESYSMSSPAVADAKWYNGEPFWNTVMKNGMKAACYFWPGSEAPIQGLRPTYWYKYDGSVPNNERVNQVVKWFMLPAAERPSFVTLYFSTVDDYGHQYGPSAQQLSAGLALVDSNVGELVQQLNSAGIRSEIDIVVVSDHGMAGTANDRRLYLANYIDITEVTIIELSVIGSIIPKDPAREGAIYDQLVAGAQRDGHFIPYWKNGPASAQPPQRYHYKDNVRITPILIEMDLGWTMSQGKAAKPRFEHGDTRAAADNGGNHGYDNDDMEMQALFIANGPSFKSGLTIPIFQNLEVYNILATVMGVRPAPNNGTYPSPIASTIMN